MFFFTMRSVMVLRSSKLSIPLIILASAFHLPCRFFLSHSQCHAAWRTGLGTPHPSRFFTLVPSPMCSAWPMKTDPSLSQPFSNIKPSSSLLSGFLSPGGKCCCSFLSPNHSLVVLGFVPILPTFL